MTRIEFARKFLKQWPKEEWDEQCRALTEMIDDERKLAKRQGFRIAMRLHEQNPAAFQEIMRTLIEGDPP